MAVARKFPSKRTRAVTTALRHEGKVAASETALAHHAKAAAQTNSPAERSQAAQKAARTRARHRQRG